MGNGTRSPSVGWAVREDVELPPGRAHERGAAAVEFSILAVVLFLLIFGIVEFSRLVAANNDVELAAREASRYGSSLGVGGTGINRYKDCAGIRAAAKEFSSVVTLSDADILITYDGGPGTSTVATCPPGGAFAGSVQDGDRILVTVDIPFSSSMPLVGGFIDGSRAAATARRTILGVSL